MIGYRNRALAEKAWHHQKHRFCNEEYKREFKDGFVSGYIDVASGGNGCSPAVAPSQYWGWSYQSANGQEAVNTWFKGFPLGVQAAEQDGVGHWQSIRTMGVMTPGTMPTQEFAPAISGDDTGITNPFNSDPEFIPVPEAVEDFNSGDTGSGLMDEVTLEAPEVIFGQTFQQPHEKIVDDGSELVLQPHIARRPEAGATQIGETMNDAPVATPIVIEDIFGSSSESIFSDSDMDELPFSFE